MGSQRGTGEQCHLVHAGRQPVEVLNAGVCGYNTYHGIMLLRSKLRNVDLDTLVATTTQNALRRLGADAFPAGVLS